MSLIDNVQLVSASLYTCTSPLLTFGRAIKITIDAARKGVSTNTHFGKGADFGVWTSERRNDLRHKTRLFTCSRCVHKRSDRSASRPRPIVMYAGCLQRHHMAVTIATDKNSSSSSSILVQ